MMGTQIISNEPFLFVSCDGAGISQPAAIQRQIKQQAMKRIAATRRRTGLHGKHNLRQLPVFQAACDDEPHNMKDDARKVVPQLCPLPEPRDSGMPRNFGILLEAMPLMGLRLGIAMTPQSMSQNGQIVGSTWASQLGGRKFLSFIPSRYGHTPSLQHATDCVIARLEHMMQPDGNRQVKYLLHYQKALEEVQRDLNDEKRWGSAETLCSTQLLGVFEALNGSSSGDFWIRHAIGASKLIQLRGPRKFKTDFEMALFLAHIGPTVMAAFLTNNTCFLADNEWTCVMQSAVNADDQLHERERALVALLWNSLAKLPTLFREATNLLLSSTHLNEDDVENLIDRLLLARLNLIGWLELLRSHTGRPTQGSEHCAYELSTAVQNLRGYKRGTQSINQLALRGTYAVCRMIKSRLLFALAPARFQHLEVEAQDIAGIVLGGHGVFNSSQQEERLQWDMFMAQSMWIAKGIFETKSSWGQDYTNHQGMLEAWKFAEWNQLIGRARK